MEKPDVLSEEAFFSLVVPSFEEIKAELSLILGGDEQWSAFLSKLYLVYINNTGTTGHSHIYLSTEFPENQYLCNDSPKKVYYKWREERIVDINDYIIKDLVRGAIVNRILMHAAPQHLGEYISHLLSYNYHNVQRTESKSYIRFLFSNIKFVDEKFPLLSQKINIIIPLTESLDANEIIDHVDSDIAILLINEKNSTNYKNFHHALDIEHLQAHFCSYAFISSISFYQRVTRKNYEVLFELIRLLKTSPEPEVYNLKEQLVALDVSDGKAFEEYLKQFLHVCLSPCFQRFDLRDQVKSWQSIRIRDFVIANKASNSDFLQSLKIKNVDFLLFDAKNYAGELTSRDLDTFREYIRKSPSFGNFGIILSRHGASSTCHESIYESLRDGMKIVVLDQDDLLLMLDYLENGKTPLDVIEDKYNDLLLQL